MNKVSVLALLICFIALCYIGGYFSVLNYEQLRAESQSLQGGIVLTTTDLRTVTRNAHTDKMSSQASLRTSNIRLANPPEASLRILDVNTTAPTLAPTGSSPPFRKYIESALISSLKPVTSDVRGNLGPAGTITNERMEDWLTDRWQAARNMGGDPIPGEHWVEVDLQGLFFVDRIMIDWEVAYSNDWTIQVKSAERGDYTVLCQSKNIAKTERPHKMHVLQHITVPKPQKSLSGRYVKLVIHRPATRFGSSIWRLQVWGTPV